MVVVLVEEKLVALRLGAVPPRIIAASAVGEDVVAAEVVHNWGIEDLAGACLEDLALAVPALAGLADGQEVHEDVVA